MGSFPNRVATQILTALFLDRDSAAAPALYTNTANTSKGIFTPSNASTGIPLYIGLIAGGTSTANNGISNGQTNLSSILNDNVIVSSGTTNWPVIPGSRGLKEFTGANNGTSRQQITFTLAPNTGADGDNIVTITGPAVPISFAASGGVTAAQPAFESIIGFFITTLASTAGTSTTNLPTILAYGTLSAARNVQAGDNPTFATNSISITLD